VTDLNPSPGPRARGAYARRTAHRLSTTLLFAAALLVLLAPAIPTPALAQQRPSPDTYESTLTGVTPAGITLKIEVLSWSDEGQRDAVIGALGDGDETAKELDKLPSVGAVWQSGSAVGHSIKYAQRVAEADGSQRIVLVTSKPLDSYSFKPWTLTNGTAPPALPYGVLELHVDSNGVGSGTFSLAAEVAVDAAAHTVGLKTGSNTPMLLSGVKLLPKPYWAKG
jgi:hypothetical protein